MRSHSARLRTNRGRHAQQAFDEHRLSSERGAGAREAVQQLVVPGGCNAELGADAVLFLPAPTGVREFERKQLLLETAQRCVHMFTVRGTSDTARRRE